MQTTQKRELSMQQCHENFSLLVAWLRLLYTATLAMSIGYVLQISVSLENSYPIKRELGLFTAVNRCRGTGF